MTPFLELVIVIVVLLGAFALLRTLPVRSRLLLIIVIGTFVVAYMVFLGRYVHAVTLFAVFAVGAYLLAVRVRPSGAA